MREGILLSLRGVAHEPAAIQALGVRLTGAGEVPALVPDLDPGGIARLVHPARASQASRHTYGPAGVAEDDRQPGTRRLALEDRLLGTLVGRLPLRRIADLQLGKDLGIELQGRLGGCLAGFHERQAE